MKQRLLLALLLIISGVASARQLYWVNGSGNWNDAYHWSLTPGGPGGAAIPSSQDDINVPLSATNDTVFINNDVYCRNFNFNTYENQIHEGQLRPSTLKGTGNIHIGGDLKIGQRFNDCFSGKWILNDVNATVRDNSLPEIRTEGHVFNGSFEFQSAADPNLKAGYTVSDNLFINNKLVLGSGCELHLNSNSLVAVLSDNDFPSDAIHHAHGSKYLKSEQQPLRANSGNNPSPLNHSVTTVIVPNPCNGDCIATATAVVTGGTGPFSYQWSTVPAQTTPTATGLCAGTYLVVVTDLSDGSQIPAFAIVTDPPPLVIFFSNTSPLCNGQCNGSSSASVAGGTPGYSFLWLPGNQTTASITNQCAGTYTLTVTDINSCTRTQQSVITQPSALAANGTSTNITCFGACNGVATVAPSGATAPYTFSWSPTANTTNQITGLCPSTHTCTITDANGCQTTYSANITQPAPLTAQNNITNASCFGVCNGAITTTPSGGTAPYTYLWLPGAQTTPNISGLCAGSYTLTVTDANSCTFSATVTVTEPTQLVVNPSGTNITCFGSCNGTAAANASGGSPGYTYSWAPSGGTGSTASGLCPNTYTVTVTDNQGCTAAGQITITQPTQLLPTVTDIDVTCFGACNGSATSNTLGGTPGYTYSWAPSGGTNATASPLCPGTYTVTVTDANGCTATGSTTITQPPQLNTNTTSTNVTCFGLCNGSASSSPSGGTGPYTYLWNPGGQTTSNVNGLCAGSYTLTVTDAMGCTRNTTVTITQPNPLQVTLNATSLNCNSVCNATISANVSGGTPAFTYLWSPGSQTTPSISNQCAGTYTCQVTDLNGCTDTAIINLTQPPQLVVTPSSTNASCNGVCDGTASVSVSGGSPGYTYSWAPGGQTTPSISGLCDGSYTVTVTDAFACTAQVTITITEPAAIQNNVTSVNATCSGSCNGSATANPTGGTAPFSFLWMPGAQTTNSISGLCAGTYTLTVTDANGCTRVTNVTITQPSPLSATISATSSSCGLCTGSASVNVSGGSSPYAYFWSPSGGTNPTATNLCLGSYTCTITDAQGCTTTASVTITQVVNINITSSGSTPSCYGACDALASANASGGASPYTYLWQPGNLATQNITGLCAGTWTVTATDANGCFSSTTITFNNPPQVVVTSTSNDVSCNNQCDGSASVSASGGTGSFTYLWMPGGQTTPGITNQCAGTYTVTVQDGNACDTTIFITINEPTLIQANAVATPANCTLCDGAIATTASGGTGPYTYLWSPGGQTTTGISSLCPGIYTVTITDATGCSVNTQIAVSNLNGPTLLSTSTDVTCNGVCDGTATTNVTGGAGPFTYDWSPGSPAGDGTPAVTGLCADTVFVQVTDVVGCITFDQIIINEPPVISAVAFTTPASCNGVCDGGANVNVSGGTGPYSYLWSPGGQTTSSIAGQCAGSYTVDITDAAGCTQQVVVNITEPGVLSVGIASTDVVCNAQCNGTATATPVGGTAPFTYSWSAGPIVPSIVNLCPGTYTCTITDASGCSVIDSVSISEPPALQQTVTSTDVLCNSVCDGTASATVTGGIPGYQYLWSPGGQTTSSVSGLCAGAYSITSTDTNGCQIVNSVTILQPAAINLAMSSSAVTCFGSCDGMAAVNAAGGAGGFTYSWAPAGGTGNTAAALCTGLYTVTVTDANGCTQTNTTNVGTPALLQANTSFTSPSCGNGSDGTATATPVGGTGPYQYLWAPGGQTTSTISGIPAGSYTVTVRDANGCVDIQIVTVTPAANFVLSVASAPANCGVCDGTINVTPSGGTAPYTYSWTGGLLPQPNQVNVCAGIYTVTVVDAIGCQDTFVIALNNSGGPTGETTTTTDATCPSSCDGSATVVPIGGTSPYTYVWNPGGQTVNSLVGMCAGNYFLQVTDANGCIRFSPVAINGPQPIAANAFVSNTSCLAICDGSIAANPSGGTGPYTYLWAPGGQTTATISGQCMGSYTLTITDASGCTQNDTITIGSWNTLTASALATAPSCNGACDGAATVTVSSGTAPFNYQWNDPLGQNSATATGLCAGNYQVVVTDASGCGATTNIAIAQPTAISVSTNVTATSCGQCNGAITVVPSGGTAPYTLQWSNGSNSTNVSGLCAGVYTVIITDATGCTNTFTIPVSSSGGPTASGLTSTDVTCFGANDGTAQVSPVGGTAPYNIFWIPGGQTTNSVSGLPAGTYYVQIQDASGCILTDSVVINAPSQILLNQSITNTDCGFCMGQIALNVTGGTGPYTYLWAPGGQTTSTISGLCAGIYTVTVTDATGCSQVVPVPVSNVNSTIVLNTASTDITCNGSCNGTGTVNITSGTGPFTYNWSSGSTSTTENSLCAGTYIVQVTDASGCVSSGAITITEPALLGTSLPFVQNELCLGACNGFITALPVGGTLPYTYAWDNLQNTQTATGLCNGTYSVVITDANGCTTSTSGTIVSPTVLVLGAPSITDAFCNNSPDGAADITVSGGSSPYTFAWTGPGAFTAATEDLSGVIAGSYTVQITDANGCQIFDTLIINALTTVIADAGSDTSACVAGLIQLDGSASVNAVTYQWTVSPSGATVGNSATSTVVPVSGVNTYVLTVTNNGCTSSDTILVNSLPQPFVDAGPDQSIIQGTTTTIGGSPTGNSGVTFAWGPSTGLGDPLSSNPVAGPMNSTTYIVTVTDSAGCTASDTMVLDIVPSIWFPDGFTPNGDGTNDTWVIDYIYLFPECEVEVYNRWGELLFRSVGYNTPWDGRYDGKDLPVGTYYYIIKLNDPMFPDVFTGPLTIMR